jgi:hypothetical protein
MHYLMTGLEALPPYSVEGTDTILWRGVNRFDLLIFTLVLYLDFIWFQLGFVPQGLS